MQKQDQLLNILACPKCHTGLSFSETGAYCGSCNINFEREDGKVISFICKELYEPAENFSKIKEIIGFWGNGWKKRLKEPDHAFLYEKDSEELRKFADEKVDNVLSKIDHPILHPKREMGSLTDKIGLNIGCGCGEESLHFAYQGASTIAMDLTRPAAEAGNYLINKIEGDGFGIQADSRFIPLKDNSVDFVFSLGVLHHSPDIQRSINEIHRVLKENGKAFIILYTTWSMAFGVQIILKGILSGNITKDKLKRHVNKNTEGAWKTESRENPLTDTFTGNEARRLFKSFKKINLRKTDFRPTNIPGLSKLAGLPGLNLLLTKEFLEKRIQWLSPIIGSALNITAEK